MVKKLLLVNPKSRNVPLILSPPLLLGVLASYVKKIFPSLKIKIVDEIIGPNLSEEDINEFSPDLVAVTCMTEFCYRAYEIAKLAKSCGVKTVVGGKHPSIFPNEAAGHFDFVVLGDGEIALSKIIEGSVNDKIIMGSPIENLDDIPPVPWELFKLEPYITAHLRDEYLKKQYPYKRVGNIHSDRGCPNSCIYCYNSTQKYKKVRYHSPGRVIDEIQHLVENYRVDHVHFIDDNLMVNAKRLKEICHRIKQSDFDITWDCAASTNAILPNKDILPIMKEAGCRAIAIGLESQSDRILKMIKGRAFSADKNIKAVRLCKDNGLIVQGNFLIGTPTENEEDLMETVNYIKKKEVDHISVQIVKPYPGTRLWTICKDMGLITDNFRWDSYFNHSFHEKFSYNFLSGILVECNNAYIPYNINRLIKFAVRRPKDAIRKLIVEKEAIMIIKRVLNID